jgi:hypothetical protein
MLVLQGHATTPDELEVVTNSAATIDVAVSTTDSNQSAPLAPENPKPDHDLISSATTTPIAVGPTTATKVTGILMVNIRNRDASLSCQVTVQLDRNSAGSDVVQLQSVNLVPGEALCYEDSIGWYKIAASPAAAPPGATNKLIGADQSLGTSEVYLNNSALQVAALGTPTVGRLFKWRLIVSKTAAGTATPIILVRVGTAGTTGDATAITFTWGAGTAAADRGEFEIEALVITAGASGVLRGKGNLTSNLATTGLSNAVKALNPADSGAINLTTANLIIGLTYNAGASGAHTLEALHASTEQL